jgi:hypothetical protein
MKPKLLPKNPHGAKLAQIFPYGWNWIEAPNEGGAPSWKTVDKFPLKPRVLWTRWQDAGTVIGVRFGSQTAYAMIDIDAGSPYHSRLQEIQEALETIGITYTIPLRSSWSGGYHIYVPLARPYPTFGVACAIRQCLEAQGFMVSPGELEIFPNEKQFAKSWLGEFIDYNAHRLPLQPSTGSCMVGYDGTPTDNSLGIFLATWDNAVRINALTQDEFAEAIAIARANRRRRGHRASGPVEDWRNDLTATIAEGWTGAGQTNQLLKDIACYGRVFERLCGVELAEYVERIATSRPGYAEWCGHQNEIWRRSFMWARAAEKYYWPLGDPPLRTREKMPDVNAQRARDARDRIADAMQQLRFEVGMTIRELVTQLVKDARCSLQTLYKNLDLWHPQPPQTQGCVTDQPEGHTAVIDAQRGIVREALETPGNSTVTHLGGGNEVWSPETLHLKNLTLGEKGGVPGGKEGLSTASTCGKLDPLASLLADLDHLGGCHA